MSGQTCSPRTASRRPARRAASTRAAAQAAAADLGWPVVLKTAAPGITHRSDVGGVVTDLHDLAAVGAAYDDLSDRLGPDVTVHQQVPAGVEVSVGIVRDDALGPMVVVAAGGVLVELLSDRAVALPPLTRDGARRMLARLRLRPLLDGCRGAHHPPTSTRWPTWSSQCHGWPTSTATSWPRST